MAEITKEKARLATLAQPAIPANVPEIVEAPSSGYRRQKVTVGDVSFLVDIVSADLGSTRVIVDTASDGTCANDCPVLPLATYVSRSGAYAGVNGTYFCPETYPSCVDKKNSFDVLVMNKNKVYFNSDNNVYSTVPVAIFSGTQLGSLARPPVGEETPTLMPSSPTDHYWFLMEISCLEEEVKKKKAQKEIEVSWVLQAVPPILE